MAFVKPPLSSLLKKIPSYVLDQRLTEEELATIGQQVLEWELKAPYLGLSETDIEDIKRSNEGFLKFQKVRMMWMWAQKKADEATLRELLRICMQQRWKKFAYKVCRALGHIKEGKLL